MYTLDDIPRIFMDNQTQKLGNPDSDARYVWSEQLAWDGEGEDTIIVGYSYDCGNRGHAVCEFPRSRLSGVLEKLEAGQSLEDIDGVVMLA